ncbi:MAG: pyrroline-5-carboxylate reductase [Patescibacteria group bacterium]|jgi:pyrroline-5-carboxylate reductase
MKKYTITIIGCGNMGTVIMERLISTGYATKRTITACDNNPERLKEIKHSGIKVESDLGNAIAKSEIIFLAIKPQQYKSLTGQLAGKFKDNQLVISIMAGVTYNSLARHLAYTNIVRTMPNLAAKVGSSITAWYAPEKCAKNNINTIKNLLSVIGTSMQVKNESMLDKVTAISGSGPAYFFYTAELLEQQARKFGFTKNEAAQLVNKTLYGAARLLENDSRSLKELRKAVTSKKGITEAAINKLGPGFVKIWKEAINAAHQKAKVISKKYE